MGQSAALWFPFLCEQNETQQLPVVLGVLQQWLQLSSKIIQLDSRWSPVWFNAALFLPNTSQEPVKHLPSYQMHGWSEHRIHHHQLPGLLDDVRQRDVKVVSDSCGEQHGDEQRLQPHHLLSVSCRNWRSSQTAVMRMAAVLLLVDWRGAGLSGGMNESNTSVSEATVNGEEVSLWID